MNASTKFALFLLFMVVLAGEVMRGGEKGLEPVPRLAEVPKSRMAPPVIADHTPPAGSGRIRRPSPEIPAVLVEAEQKKKNSVATGTAFSVGSDGVWITARHVTEGCGRVLLLVNEKQAMKAAKVLLHPASDISVLVTGSGAKALAFESDAPSYDQEGFHFGYPRGNPGDVYSRLIGQTMMITSGSRHGREPVLVWAEKKRNPPFGGSLGGISGGPILDREGKVAGIHVAGAVRRGRSYSADIESARQLMGDNGFAASAEGSALSSEVLEHLNSAGFTVAGQILRRQLSVAKVVCLTGDQ